MIELGKHLGFLLEAMRQERLALAAKQELPLQHLECDGLLQQRVPAVIDNPRAAFAQQSAHFVVANPIAIASPA